MCRALVCTHLIPVHPVKWVPSLFSFHRWGKLEAQRCLSSLSQMTQKELGKPGSEFRSATVLIRRAGAEGVSAVGPGLQVATTLKTATQHIHPSGDRSFLRTSILQKEKGQLKVVKD